MKIVRSVIALLLCLCLLSGCSIYNGSYSHVVPHELQSGQNQSVTLRAGNYEQFCRILDSLVSSATSNAAIYVDGIPDEKLETMLHDGVAYLLKENPIGAFALEDVTLEPGTKQGSRAVAAELSYGRSAVEIRRIISVADIADARVEVENALAQCKPNLTLNILAYQETDFTQMVTDLSRGNIQYIMECPHVAEAVYGSAQGRVVELIFTYENSRDALRAMQAQVQPIFNAANLYVSGDDGERQKYSHLYAFLMERFDYTYETSITPSYSLLLHGVGDSRTFASVYAAMCRNAGLECEVITGTRSGEPWVWNRIRENDEEYYVDLIRCTQNGGFRELRESELAGYVWDYSDLSQPQQEEDSTE